MDTPPPNQCEFFSLSQDPELQQPFPTQAGMSITPTQSLGSIHLMCVKLGSRNPPCDIGSTSFTILAKYVNLTQAIVI